MYRSPSFGLAIWAPPFIMSASATLACLALAALMEPRFLVRVRVRVRVRGRGRGRGRSRGRGRGRVRVTVRGRVRVRVR